MSINELIASLKRDTLFRAWLVKHTTYMNPVTPHYSEHGLSQGMKDLIKQSGMERYHTLFYQFVCSKMVLYFMSSCIVNEAMFSWKRFDS
jgi:uncharacterized membrane protein YbaN (DUF454 family)